MDAHVLDRYTSKVITCSRCAWPPPMHPTFFFTFPHDSPCDFGSIAGRCSIQPLRAPFGSAFLSSCFLLRHRPSLAKAQAYITSGCAKETAPPAQARRE